MSTQIRLECLKLALECTSNDAIQAQGAEVVTKLAQDFADFVTNGFSVKVSDLPRIHAVEDAQPDFPERDRA